jgi:predicted nucleotidyltransferase
MIESQIISILEQAGSLTGAELVERTRTEVFALWHACKQSPAIRLETIGKRFLRLDRVVNGYARLSPSIRREFLTYTLAGLESQSGELACKAEALRNEIKKISRAKLDLARESVSSAVESLPDRDAILPKVCFIIAGDITYEMSHLVPRPEKSTGEFVRGSDLDIIVITENDLPAESSRLLDQAIYRKKYFLLVHPDYREEIDYLVKDVNRVREQLRFDTFESMVACKILDEGMFLYGSQALFQKIKDLVVEHGIPEKLREMRAQAIGNRKLAEIRLLELEGKLSEGEAYHLFYTREEGEEIY